MTSPSSSSTETTGRVERPSATTAVLDWRPGLDPTPRDWNTTGVAGTPKHRGHYELLTHRPAPEVTRSAGESG